MLPLQRFIVTEARTLATADALRELGVEKGGCVMSWLPNGLDIINVLLAANYFDVGKVRSVAKRVGAVPVVISLAPGGEPGIETFFDQFDVWLDRLEDARAKTK